MGNYKILKNQIYSTGKFSILPIRLEDRFLIMKWRNEQIYHLRQNRLLTEQDQDNYFQNIVCPLFKQDEPDQILFSFLYDHKFVGYGGLVHINWYDKNAEISFLIDTQLEGRYFNLFWEKFLELIGLVAFEDLNLNKIYTFAFDLRPMLYPALIRSGFNEEAVLKRHVFFNKKYIDVVIHSKFAH